MASRMISAVVVIAVFVVVIAGAVAVYFGMEYVPPSDGDQDNDAVGGKPAIEMPLAEVKAAVASAYSVSQSDVEVYFCVQAEEVDNDDFAAGVVISDQRSLVFIFDNSTGTIVTPVENDYTATGDAIQAMSTIALKDVTSPYAQDHLGHFNSNKIVPCSILKTNGAYTFNYYDGYVEYPVSIWGNGTATLENGAVTFTTHGWS